MKLFEILLEYASIPKTSYGYWIDPDGRYWVVGPYQHYQMAAKLFKDRGYDPSYHDPYSYAYSIGAIRVVFERDNVISFEFITPTHAAKKAAWFLTMSHKADLEVIYVDATGATDHNVDPELHATDTFEGIPPRPAGHFAQWLNGVKTQ